MHARENNWLAQPFTFRGIAAFGQASLGRLLFFQTAVATLVGLVVVTLFEIGWVPVVQRTIAALPPTGAIRKGTLQWPRPVPVRTPGSSFLWISIDPTDSVQVGEGADLQFEFKRTELRIRSLLGYLGVPYPDGFIIGLNRTELEPWWGAWHPAIAVGVVGGVILGLLGTWGTLALIYAWPVRLISFYADRKLSWFGAWRVAAACLLPGALFFAVSILGYTFHRLNLVQLLGAAVLHLMMGWVYVLCAPFCLPRVELPAKVRANPFRISKSSAANPFAARPGQNRDT